MAPQSLISTPQKRAPNFSIPEERYQLVKIGKSGEKNYATVIDLKHSVKYIVADGDYISSFRVWMVDEVKNIVRLRGANQASVTLKLSDE